MSKTRKLRMFLSIGFSSVLCLMVSGLARGDHHDVLSPIRGPDPGVIIPRLTVNGSAGAVTLRPIVITVPGLPRDIGRVVRSHSELSEPRDVLIATVAWDVPRSVDFPFPSVTLHVTESPLNAKCYHGFNPEIDLTPSFELVAGGGSGHAGLDFRSSDIRPGRTYYVQGCVWKNTERGFGFGIPTNSVPVTVNWDTTTRPPNLYVNSVRHQPNSDSFTPYTVNHPNPGPRFLTSLGAEIEIVLDSSYDSALFDSMPDRLLIEVYLNDDPEPIVSRVVSDIKEKLALGRSTSPGMRIQIVHPLPITHKTHRITYVINADGSVPENNYEDNAFVTFFGYRVGPFYAGPAICDPQVFGQKPFAIRRIWSDRSEQGDAYAWVNVEINRLLVACDLRTIWSSALLPENTYLEFFDTPVIGLEIEGVNCIGGDDRIANSKPTVMWHRTSVPLDSGRVRRFFCYNTSNDSPFTSSGGTATLSWGGVSSRKNFLFLPRKTWLSKMLLPDPQLPDLSGRILYVDFLGRAPDRYDTGVPEMDCGVQPTVSILIANQGAQKSPPTTGYLALEGPENISGASVYGDPACSSQRTIPHVTRPLEYYDDYFDIPEMEPGETYLFEKTWLPGVNVHRLGHIKLEVDPVDIVVEHSAFPSNNFDVANVPTRNNMRPRGTYRWIDGINFGWYW